MQIHILVWMFAQTNFDFEHFKYELQGIFPKKWNNVGGQLFNFV